MKTTQTSRPEFNTLTGQFEYSEAHAARQAAAATANRAATVARNAAAAGMTVAEYEGRDMFAEFG